MYPQHSFPGTLKSPCPISQLLALPSYNLFSTQKPGDSVKRKVRPPHSSARIPPKAPDFTQSESQSLTVTHKAHGVGPSYSHLVSPAALPLSYSVLVPLAALLYLKHQAPPAPALYLAVPRQGMHSPLSPGFTQRSLLKEPFSGQRMKFSTFYTNPTLSLSLDFFLLLNMLMVSYTTYLTFISFVSFTRCTSRVGLFTCPAHCSIPIT